MLTYCREAAANTLQRATTADPGNVWVFSHLRTRFFFQSDEGIRDGHVTGVQTCALPIWPRLTPGATPSSTSMTVPRTRRPARTTCSRSTTVTGKTERVLNKRALMPGRSCPVTVTNRSEERRVGIGYNCEETGGHPKKRRI